MLLWSSKDFIWWYALYSCIRMFPVWQTDLEIKREGNVLFNDALNTFYLRLYGVGHMVYDHSDNERGNLLPPLYGIHF